MSAVSGNEGCAIVEHLDENQVTSRLTAGASAQDVTRLSHAAGLHEITQAAGTGSSWLSRMGAILAALLT
jgi:hypothetical protein